jgi:hypothetical protein
MIQYRVTKYDPALRNNAGAFLRDDWTSFSDVGTAVSLDAYSEVEDAYVRAAVAFMQESDVRRLAIRGLENPSDACSDLVEGAFLGPERWGNAFRSVLRDIVWCRFEGGSAFVHFGHDFYMYVGTPSSCPAAISSAEANGLFVEVFRSPYWDNGDSYIGKHLLVGLTYVDSTGRVTDQVQMHGVITRIDSSGIHFTPPGSDKEFSVPPNLDALEPAEPAVYTLRGSGEQVTDPDLLASWTIVSPPE